MEGKITRVSVTWTEDTGSGRRYRIYDRAARRRKDHPRRTDGRTLRRPDRSSASNSRQRETARRTARPSPSAGRTLRRIK